LIYTDNNNLKLFKSDIKEIYENYYIIHDSKKIYIFDNSQSISLRESIAHDLINMIIANIMLIKDINMSYDEIFFNMFERCSNNIFEEYIENYTYDIVTIPTKIRERITFYDYNIYTESDNYYYYNKNYNYLVKFEIKSGDIFRYINSVHLNIL
jgi:hypothetical protein